MSSYNFIIWITGFSGAGKTTVAKVLQKKLQQENISTVLLDGDELRESLGFVSHYSCEERKELAYKYAKLAKLISGQGVLVIVATISMFEEVRLWNRTNDSKYIEVYLKVSKEERKRRDPKKLYLSQKICMVPESDVYEEPKNSDLVFDEEYSLEEIVIKIRNYLLEKIDGKNRK